MKNWQIIFTCAIFMITLAGCKLTDQDSILRIYKYVNQSGVEVAMVGEAYGNIPDSLVIANGNTYECSRNYPALEEIDYPSDRFPYNFGDPDNESKFIPLKVYFNKNVCVSYTYKDKGKNPVMTDNDEAYTYERKEKKHRTTIIKTYTFTPEDYQKAIDAQNQL